MQRLQVSYAVRLIYIYIVYIYIYVVRRQSVNLLDILFDKLIDIQIVKFYASCLTRAFIIAFTLASDWPLF